MYALPIINVGVALVIAALGMRTRPADMLLLFRNPILGVRALLAMFVFVPACALLVAWSLPVEPAIRASLLALSVAPMAAILLRAETKANVDGDLMLALEHFGAATPVDTLTTNQIAAFFASDLVTRTKKGTAKARPTILKTRRVLRLALTWAVETNLVERLAPLPERDIETKV